MPYYKNDQDERKGQCETRHYTSGGEKVNKNFEIVIKDQRQSVYIYIIKMMTKHIKIRCYWLIISQSFLKISVIVQPSFNMLTSFCLTVNVIILILKFEQFLIENMSTSIERAINIRINN